jgi:adenosylcobinamide-phosphate synthase
MLELVLAFILDLRIGDPVYPFHPVRLMGKAIERSETFLRSAIRDEKIAGAILALSFPWIVFAAVWVLLFLLGRIHWALAWTLSVYGIYVSLSVHDLRKEALQIYAGLGKGDLEKARLDLARIVGRDTQSLDKKEIVRASVETVAESSLDGVIAPLFFAALGGAPLALAYKAVNTLDSMIGHLNERYRDFGFFAAKQDEFWNWLPARLSYYFSAFAALFVTGRMDEALHTGWQDGMSAPHGNGAIPEAAYAGALGLRLGGPSAYQGRVVEKPYLGIAQKDFDREDLLKSIQLMIAASYVSLAAMVVLRFILMIIPPLP